MANKCIHSGQQCLVVWAFVLTMMSTGHILSEGGAGAESGPSKKKRERKKATAAAHEATSSGNEHSNALAETVWWASNQLLGERVARRKTWHPPPRRGEKIYRKAQVYWAWPPTCLDGVESPKKRKSCRTEKEN